MSIRNLKDNSSTPWLCECYPNGRTGKRVRKRFTTKGEAAAFEKFIMRETEDKPWLGDKPDHRRLSDLLDIWWKTQGHTLKSGKRIQTHIKRTIKDLGDPIASNFTARQYLEFRSGRTNHWNEKNPPISPKTMNNELILQRILGHQKIEQTMAYAHFSPDHLIQAVQLNPLEN